jgi:hypothetical protein
MTVLYPNEITYMDVKYVLRQDRGPESMVESTIEILQDKELFTAFSWGITAQDHSDVRDKAIRNIIRLPTRCRMRGMIVDLNFYERRALCYLDATIEMLSAKGLVDPSKIMGPAVYTEVQEVLDEGVVGHTFTKQRD